jgi:hypothetical protein
MKHPPEIKTPCPKRWEEMRGDAATRFCDHCELHVQNLSAMSSRKVAHTLARSGSEHVCITYTRRRDGSMVTRWQMICERLLLPLRRGFAWSLAALVPIAFGACATQQTQSQLTGRVGPRSQAHNKASEEERVIVTGGI